jgi:hypothetical protein
LNEESFDNNVTTVKEELAVEISVDSISAHYSPAGKRSK